MSINPESKIVENTIPHAALHPSIVIGPKRSKIVPVQHSASEDISGGKQSDAVDVPSLQRDPQGKVDGLGQLDATGSASKRYQRRRFSRVPRSGHEVANALHQDHSFDHSQDAGSKKRIRRKPTRKKRGSINIGVDGTVTLVPRKSRRSRRAPKDSEGGDEKAGETATQRIVKLRRSIKKSGTRRRKRESKESEPADMLTIMSET